MLGALGAERAWLVHGSDGLDEITTTGPTAVVASEAARSRASPSARRLRLPRATLADLRGGDPAHNAAALRAVLGGARNAYRDIAVLNAAAALVVAGRAADLSAGVGLAQAALDSAARRRPSSTGSSRASNGGLRAAAMCP